MDQPGQPVNLPESLYVSGLQQWGLNGRYHRLGSIYRLEPRLIFGCFRVMGATLDIREWKYGQRRWSITGDERGPYVDIWGPDANEPPTAPLWAYGVTVSTQEPQPARSHPVAAVIVMIWVLLWLIQWK
jgi:hypothetical protein